MSFRFFMWKVSMGCQGCSNSCIFLSLSLTHTHIDIQTTNPNSNFVEDCEKRGTMNKANNKRKGPTDFKGVDVDNVFIPNHQKLLFGASYVDYASICSRLSFNYHQMEVILRLSDIITYQHYHYSQLEIILWIKTLRTQSL